MAPIASITVVYEVGTETLKFRFVASCRSFPSGSPEASTFCESADGTNAMLIGLLVEPFWSPVGAGGATGFGTAAATGLAAAAGAGLAAGAADGAAAGLAAAEGDAATEGDDTGAVVGFAAGAAVGAGAEVGAAGAD